MRFNYQEKVRTDYLADIVKPMVKQRKELGLSQEDVDAILGVADRLVSKWECGVRTPTSFHLYCWADALEGQMVFLPNKEKPLPCIDEKVYSAANDNNWLTPEDIKEKVINDNLSFKVHKEKE
ncbi:MAG: helix-turn-helix transcriptional regulator [Bacteroidota bacterium]